MVSDGPRHSRTCIDRPLVLPSSAMAADTALAAHESVAQNTRGQPIVNGFKRLFLQGLLRQQAMCDILSLSRTIL